MPKFHLPPHLNHNTDWLMDNAIMKDAVKAILSEYRIDRSYDIPYVAGYNVSGKVLYLDKNMPIGFTDSKGKFWHTDEWILIHEAIEKTLLTRYKVPYIFAHQIALRVEQEAVLSAGCSWNEYNEFCMNYVKKVAHIPPKSVPKDLDLTPYKQEKDTKVLKELRSLMEVEHNQYAQYLALNG